METFNQENFENYKQFIQKPFLKWVGGKSQIIEDVLKLFPTKIKTYYEPFLGGGSVLLGVLSLQKVGYLDIDKIIAYDLNPYLIATYHNIKIDYKKVFKEIQELIENYKKSESDGDGTIDRNPESLSTALNSRESYYYWCRKQYCNMSDEEKTSYKGSALFIFLNKTCFRGLYRTGPNGFNVPYGHYKTIPTIVDKNHLKEISNLIQNVDFIVSDFNQSLENVEETDFVYMDPPYVPENMKSFVSYCKDGFGEQNHLALFNICRSFQERQIDFLLSNSYVPLILETFNTDNFDIKKINCRRAINSKNPESKTNEVLISPII